MDEQKKVSWNASQGLIAELSNRRSYANTFFINGDIKRAFNTLIAIKQSVIQSFNNKERNELKEIEDKFNKISSLLNSSNSFNQEIRKGFLIAKGLAIKIYSEYNERIMDLLEQYGYLIGEQSDASRMKF